MCNHKMLRIIVIIKEWITMRVASTIRVGTSDKHKIDVKKNPTMMKGSLQSRLHDIRNYIMTGHNLSVIST